MRTVLLSLFALRPRMGSGRCRISPPRFLAECCKRQLNQVSLVLLYFRLSAFSDLYWVCLSVFSRTVLFVSISQVIGCEDRLRNDLYCVGWGVKLYSNQTKANRCPQRGPVRRVQQCDDGLVWYWPIPILNVWVVTICFVHVVWVFLPGQKHVSCSGGSKLWPGAQAPPNRS